MLPIHPLANLRLEYLLLETDRCQEAVRKFQAAIVEQAFVHFSVVVFVVMDCHGIVCERRSPWGKSRSAGSTPGSGMDP